ncbi:MAG: hypothetical protein U5J83_04685 [Bryobacterales bacterium]|nr:hypothetical protein [Bryobacterales bacterium]
MQHVNIKLFAEGLSSDSSGHNESAAVIPVFHRWIQQKSLPGLLIDVADYAHVPNGPGVLLIAHEFDIGLEHGGGRLGLLYNRKEPFEGSGLEALRSAYAYALDAARRLEAEPEFAGKLRFRFDEVQVTLNDRLLYPNTEATMEATSEDFAAFFREIFGGPASSLERDPDPRTRFAVTARK